MSFVERNKNWVLPLLGVMALGVIYMNFQMFKPKPKAPEPPGAAPPLTATAPAAVIAAPPPPAPEPTPAGPRKPDLWSDLRALEEPWAGLNQADALLKQGSQPLKAELLHPVPWVLPLPVSLRVPEPLRGAPTTPATLPSRPSAPPPEVDFLILNPKGTSAWLGGSGFRVGQVLAGGWKVRRITPDMVEVEGPGGVIRRWTNPVKAKMAPKIPSPEAP